MENTLSSNPLIFGHNTDGGIVAVEHVQRKTGDAIVLWIRKGQQTEIVEDTFRPFLWITEAALFAGYPQKIDFQPLQGNGLFKYLAFFPSWKEFDKAIGYLKKTIGRNPSDVRAPYYLINDPVQQYLLWTGRTLFKNMPFRQLKRLQMDIETYCDPSFEFSNPERETDCVIAISLADETGWSKVLFAPQGEEKKIIQEWVDIIRERDPDVIEGHNIFKFDLPYLFARAKLHGIGLSLGRDGSKPYVRSSRYMIAEQVVSYPRTEIFGRHIVDTYFLVQAYDVSLRAMESFSLKDAAIFLGVAQKDRTYVDGADIAGLFTSDPERLKRYALDDVLETRAVSDLLSPSYFTQAQMLPFTYQNICVRGNGTKIDHLLLREYLRQGYSISSPGEARDFAGGYTDIFFTGVAKNVHHCDARSLYPSIMLKDHLGPRKDELNVFLTMLKHLRDYRLDAKARKQSSQSPDEKLYYDALQTTFKILINSFYGYLGFSQGHFNDYDRAEQIAATGRAILTQMIEWIRAHGGQPIEIDTDGIYFVPPPFHSRAEIEQFRQAFQASLPEGIDIEFDGEYVVMFSYKMKNYALLDADGNMTIKGAALKSRGLEPFQRQYLRSWIKFTLEEKPDEIERMKQQFRQAITNREWPIKKFAKTETLQDAPATYAAKIGGKARGRNAAYELALKSGRDFRAGDQISYYITGTKKAVAAHENAKMVSEWDPTNRDENVAYYLAKLDALIKKFETLDEEEEKQGTLDLGLET